MKKHWKLFLFFLVLVAIAFIVGYRRVVYVCPVPFSPYPSHTFEWNDNEGWYAPAVSCQKNEKGEMVCVWYDSYYRYTSNTVTGVETKERRQK